MCRAIKASGLLLVELSILLSESFIKSSKRQGLCGWNRAEHMLQSKWTLQHAARQEVRVCVYVRVCDNAGKQKRKTETSAVQHQTIIYLIRSTRVTQSQNFDF